MHPLQRIPNRLILLLVVSLFALTVVLFTASPAPAVPTINWMPSSVNQTILAGQSKTVQVSFTASEDVKNVVARVVPALLPYIQVSPSSFASIVKGQKIDLSLTIVSPASALPGTVDGTIQLRSGSDPKKTFAKPLPVTIEVWQRVAEVVSGASFGIPPTWSSEVSDGLLLISSPVTNLKRSDPEQFDVPPDIRVEALPNPGAISIDAYALQFTEGWFSRYAQQNRFTVAGREAVTFSDLGAEVGHAPVLAIFVAVSESRVLLITTLGYESDLTSERLEVFQQIVNSLTFE